MVYARNIIRTKIKNEGPRKKSSPASEPDFYSMPKLQDARKKAEFQRRFPVQQHPATTMSNLDVLQSLRGRMGTTSGQRDAAACAPTSPLQVASKPAGVKTPERLVPSMENSSASTQASLLLSQHLRLQKIQDLLGCQSCLPSAGFPEPPLSATEQNLNAIRRSSWLGGEVGSPSQSSLWRENHRLLEYLILSQQATDTTALPALTAASRRPTLAAAPQFETKPQDYAVLAFLRGIQ